MPPRSPARPDAAVQALLAAAVAIEDQVTALPTPLERVRATTELLQDVAGLQRKVAALRMTAVGDLRQLRWSYRAIGQAVNLSPNAVAQIEKQRLRGVAHRPGS